MCIRPCPALVRVCQRAYFLCWGLLHSNVSPQRLHIPSAHPDPLGLSDRSKRMNHGVGNLICISWEAGACLFHGHHRQVSWEMTTQPFPLFFTLHWLSDSGQSFPSRSPTETLQQELLDTHTGTWALSSHILLNFPPLSITDQDMPLSLSGQEILNTCLKAFVAV